MKKLIFILACATACLFSCQKEESETKRILENEGYTNIHLTGYDAFGCSEKDTFSTGFTATSAAGKQVKGVVCSGLMKGATIRIY